jgi:hypothetical protein
VRWWELRRKRREREREREREQRERGRCERIESVNGSVCRWRAPMRAHSAPANVRDMRPLCFVRTEALATAHQDAKVSA